MVSEPRSAWGGEGQKWKGSQVPSHLDPSEDEKETG